MVMRERVIGVQPNQIAQEMRLPEINDCHLLLKSMIVLFLVAINCSVRAFSCSCSF